MKSFIYILLTSLTFLVVGCQNESEEIRLINQAERLFDAYPDSVITTLDSIPLPEEMSPRLIARWCMLYARAADKIEDEMPYTNQLEIALKYYQKKKMREEEAEIGLYLGRSYVEDKEYEKAMRTYSDALKVALAIKDYNRAGYICSYMGDLYEVDLRYILAAEKYKESGKYFHLANNTTSYVRAFVNEGRSYMSVDSNYLALASLKQAEVIMDSLNVENVKTYVYNGLGNIYNDLGDYDLAEYYILRCIELDPEEVASDYLSLVDIEKKRGNLEKAEQYLRKASDVPADNELVPITIAYYNYVIKKKQDDLKNALDFFEKEFHSLDSRTSAILKSEITRITNIFVSDYNISQTFCAPLDELNFKGFSSMLNCGKIVILNMNIAEYKNLSKLISAYLKLDFQSEVMYNLSKNKAKTCAFICDEYAEYVTKTDADFFSLSREAKCINIVSTQSYSSLKNTLKDDNSVKVIIQNLINKLWFRTDDIYTIEEVQKQLGKEDKEKTSSTISENAKETYFNYITNSFNSKNSNITESYNTYTQSDFIFDTNFFTQNLEIFSCLAFLSDGEKILTPQKLKMFPYFK